MTSSDRHALIARCLALGHEKDDLVFRDRGTRDLGLVKDELNEAFEAYTAALEPVELSRDPVTGEVFALHLDTLGLQTPWWSRDPVIRPPSDRLPKCFAFTGAMMLGGPPPNTPWLVAPGPEVPYVVPRLLEPSSITAVLSSVTVGDHQGYLIAYFADGPDPEVTRINQWGLGDYWAVDANGEAKWDETYESSEVRDFDLAPWIQRGRLRWIAPADASLTLHDTVDGCPYLGLEGIQRAKFIQRGDIWHFDD